MMNKISVIAVKIGVIAVMSAVLVAAVLGVVFWLKGNSTATSTSGDRAEVTGYATSNMFGDTSGAVSVVLRGASAARIDQLAEGLPAANIDDLCTFEDRMYQITFTAGADAKQGLDVIGWGTGRAAP